MIRKINICSNLKTGSEALLGVRVDFNNNIGFGHIKRIINFLDLVENKKKVIFFSNYQNNYFNKIKVNKNYLFFKLKEEKNYNLDFISCKKIIEKNNFYFDLFIIDNYKINNQWQKKINIYAKKTIMINDFIKKKFSCNYYINNNYGSDKLINKNKNKNKFFGNDYFIFPKNFNYNLKKKSIDYKINTFGIKRTQILIHFGNYNKINIYKNIFTSLNKLNLKINLIIINSDEKIIKKISNMKFINIRFKIINFTNNLINYYIKSHIVIGAGGVSMMERIFFNVPSFIVQIANNQKIAIKNLNNDKIIYYLGDFNPNFNILITMLKKYTNDKKKYISDVHNLSKIYKKSKQLTLNL